MSATAPTSEDTEKSKRGMLDALVKQDRTVEVPSDDTLDRARNMEPEDFKAVFEKKVNGVSGFKAPLPRDKAGK